MLVPRRARFAGLEQLLPEILPNGFEKAIANLAGSLFGDDERLVDDARQEDENVDAGTGCRVSGVGCRRTNLTP
jgi:hypothetical protein